MTLQEFIQAFTEGMRQTTVPEYIAVFAGIASVWFSRRENILVYPVGLINTLIYIWLSARGDLLGEAAVNLYYSVMSVYGWYNWSRRDREHHLLVQITRSDRIWWQRQLLFFFLCFALIFFALDFLKKDFAPGAIPWADALASASAFTGMWLMTRKKLESWYWWIITNISSIPLYFVKGYVFTSVYYLILLFMAVSGWLEWSRRIRSNTFKNA